MARFKFGDIVKEVKINVDRTNNPYEFYVAGDHMDTEDIVIRRKGRFATDDVGPAFTRIFKPGQILYGSRRTYLKKVAVADFEGICANTTFVLETKDSNVLLQELLPFIMLTDSFTSWSVSHSKGSTNPYVLFSDLADYELDLPSIEEQRILAAKLSAAQKLKESYRRLLIDTEELVKSQFIEMLGNPRTNPKGWPIKTLPDIASYSIGLTYKPEHVCENGTIVLRSGNIQDGEIDLQDLVRVNTPIRDSLWIKEGDILMCSRNGSASLVGKVAQIKSINEPMTYGAFMTIIRSDYSDYLYLYFQSGDFRNQISGGKSSTMNQITQKMLDKIEIPLPNQQIINSLSSILKQADKSKFADFKSQFIEMFGKHSEVVKLKDIVNIMDDKRKPINEGERSSMKEGNLYPYYGATGVVDFINAYLTDERLLCIAEDCGNYGPGEESSYIIEGKAWVNNHAHVVKPNDELCDITYLHNFLKVTDLLPFVSGTTRKKLTQKAMNNLDIILPPINKQREYVSICDHADKSKSINFS